MFVNVNVVLHFPTSMHNLQPTVAQDKHNSVDLDSQLQEQERIITISYALASEASQRSKEVAGNSYLQNNSYFLPASKVVWCCC